MTETLQQTIERLRELQKGASDGEWEVVPPSHANNDSSPLSWYVVKKAWGCIARPHPDSPQWPLQEANMKFLAATPAMMHVINELEAENKRLREGLITIRDGHIPAIMQYANAIEDELTGIEETIDELLNGVKP